MLISHPIFSAGPRVVVDVQSLSRLRLFVTPQTAAGQASLSITNSWSFLKPMSTELVMPSNQLILWRPLPLLPSIFPSIRVFSNESALPIRWPKYWSFSFSISPSNEHSGLVSFRMGWLDLLAVQGTPQGLPRHVSVSECHMSQRWWWSSQGASGRGGRSSRETSWTGPGFSHRHDPLLHFSPLFYIHPLSSVITEHFAVTQSSKHSWPENHPHGEHPDVRDRGGDKCVHVTGDVS